MNRFQKKNRRILNRVMREYYHWFYLGCGTIRDERELYRAIRKWNRHGEPAEENAMRMLEQRVENEWKPKYEALLDMFNGYSKDAFSF